jgi:hypothetical protein
MRFDPIKILFRMRISIMSERRLDRRYEGGLIATKFPRAARIAATRTGNLTLLAIRKQALKCAG